jgi:hypothetical protein
MVAARHRTFGDLFANVIHGRRSWTAGEGESASRAVAGAAASPVSKRRSVASPMHRRRDDMPRETLRRPASLPSA